ncbi:SPRY-domain-containing protein [Backusella circina FSU 941]|nr:SPRY-domain-containing protein [Backusella circina FSU 941]
MHKVIEVVWKRIISLAKDFSYSISREHEQALIKALEELLVIINQDNIENGYISFFLVLLHHLDSSCAISLSFLKHVIEKSDLPSPSTLCHIIEHIIKTEETSVNSLVFLILFSQRFSGHLSESMFTDSLCTFLIHSALFHDNNSVRVYALLALDGFAMTGSIKNAILSHPLNIKRGLSVLVQECENSQKKKRNSIFDWWLFKRQKKYTIDLSCDWNQLELCAKWSFDYTFGKKGKEERNPKIESNVILDKMTATHHCKLSRDCLALRNDQSYFESIRATACVFSGKWYFETLIFTSGIIHIGWSTFQSKFQPELGYGVGDDPYGFGFDTYRSAIWCAGKVTYPSKSKHIQCQPGDVIGSFLDADKRICSFFINGQEIAHFKYNQRLEGLYPSFSLSTLQHIQVNFGNRPWHYERRRSNVQLKPITKRNLPVRDESDNDDDLCILCFSEPKSVMLLPCQHTEFGHACSKLIKQCPLCRSEIQHIKTPSLVS